jgi:broad specificity phosphatase PhoE
VTTSSSQADIAAAQASFFTRTRWWWIRHAPVRSDGGRIYGQGDVSCDCGDRHIFEKLASELPRDAVWVTSQLARTRQTAEALWAAGYVSAGEAPPVPIVVPELAEQHLGDWQGLDRARFFAERQPAAASYWFAPADETPPGGESFAALCQRVSHAIERVTGEHAGRDIIAVAHGGSIRAAIRHALGLEPQAGLAFAIENCSLTRLDHYASPDGSGWRVGLINRHDWPAGVIPRHSAPA